MIVQAGMDRLLCMSLLGGRQRITAGERARRLTYPTGRHRSIALGIGRYAVRIEA
jgi:hypothetical protein